MIISIPAQSTTSAVQRDRSVAAAAVLVPPLVLFVVSVMDALLRIRLGVEFTVANRSVADDLVTDDIMGQPPGAAEGGEGEGGLRPGARGGAVPACSRPARPVAH